MKQMKRVTLLLMFLITCGFSQTINVESLLNDMVDRDKITNYPETDFRLKQHTSYSRKSKTPEDKEGWFDNRDFNKEAADNGFIRIEKNAKGEDEWVLMDHNQPGVIVRTWVPFNPGQKGTTTRVIRIYLDGATQPTFEGNMFDLMNGNGLFPFPFAHKSLYSAISFFPIPYAKSCKITSTEQPFFFQYTFREYGKGADIETFSVSDMNKHKDLIKKVGEAILTPKNFDSGTKLSLSKSLNQNQEATIDLPKGEAAIRTLQIKLGDYKTNPDVTRKVVLKIEFDGSETVWCPIGDFYGTGIGLHPYQGWDHTVTEDGTLSCRYVMPYKKSGKISIVNLSDTQVKIDLKAYVGDFKWTKNTMYFNAAWKGEYPVPTMPRSDWNYIDMKGKGVYVGDALTVMNPIARWWGEGDEKIFVDGEDFPSLFGTGTEDYYGYSWGGVATDFYEHPFHAQPRSHKYNKLNRKQGKERNTSGYSTELRNRALDVMPFGSSLKLDMEVWHWESCEMGYQVGMYWYSLGANTNNGIKDVTEVLNVPQAPNPLPTAKGKKSKNKKANGNKSKGKKGKKKGKKKKNK